MHTIGTMPSVAHPSDSIARRSAFGRVIHWLTWRVAVRRSRMVLRELSNAQLRDIGLTREQAGLEASLPWWR